MSLKIPIESSARHVHITKEDFEALFGPGRDLTYVKELSQPGQFLAKERVNIQGPRGGFENVAILGPFRKTTQVEVSVTDTKRLGIPALIRQSGYIEQTPGCTLSHGEKALTISQGVIVAKRHIHMTPSEAIRLHVQDNENVFVLTQSYERALIFADVVVRVDPNFRLAMHVDTDEANAFSNDDSPYGTLIKLFDNKTYNMQMWAEELQSGIDR